MPGGTGILLMDPIDGWHRIRGPANREGAISCAEEDTLGSPKSDFYRFHDPGVRPTPFAFSVGADGSMAPDSNHRHAFDLRPSEELVSLYLSDPDSDEGEEALSILHYRGGVEELGHGIRLAKSPNEIERIAGADLLAQLGWGEPTYLEETVAILIELLSDPVDSVVSSAAIALSHRHHPRCIGPLLSLASHPNPAVRYGVVLALGGREESDAVSGLIELTRDRERDVRNWATFGISQLIELNSPEIREALIARADDEDPEIRGEALIGLSLRADPRALAFVQREVRGDFHGSWAVEAAGRLGHPTLHPLLEELFLRLDPEDREQFGGVFTEAIESCRSEH